MICGDYESFNRLDIPVMKSDLTSIKRSGSWRFLFGTTHEPHRNSRIQGDYLDRAQLHDLIAMV